MDRRIVLAAGISLALTRCSHSRNEPLLKTAKSHPMQYYLSLPDNWNAARKWPILVTVDGSNKQWARNARTFAAARGDRPLIIVTPLVVSNSGRIVKEPYNYSEAVWQGIAQTGPSGFDDAGVHAVVSEVRKEYNGEEKVLITGFSAGGHLAWLMVLMHPEDLTGAVLACGGYVGRGITRVSDSADRVRLPILGIQGANDPARNEMEACWRRGKAEAEAHGYRNLSFVSVPGVGHSPFASEVMSFLDTKASAETRY